MPVMAGRTGFEIPHEVRRAHKLVRLHDNLKCDLVGRSVEG